MSDPGDELFDHDDYPKDFGFGAPEYRETCERCCGNGEIILDWEQYLHPVSDAAEEASVAECPDCGGDGKLDPLGGKS